MPDFSFAEALRQLGPEASFRIVNEARPSTDYLFESLLPEQNKTDYHVDSGFMTVRPTMAGLVSMSAPYPPGGAISLSTFLERSAKIALEVALEEEALRQIHAILARLSMMGGDTNQALIDEALNFYENLIVQALMDTSEWLRAEALYNGVIDWDYGKLNLSVDYGVPAAFLPAQRTGTDAYDSSASKFWVDHYAALEALFYNVRCIIVHVKTWLKIMANPVNNFQIVNSSRTSSGNTIYTVQRFVPRGSTNVMLSTDYRDTFQVITYDLEGEILDPVNPGQTLRVPFAKLGKLLYVANNKRSGYRVGEGSKPDPIRDQAVGYTHVAPTVEGNGRPGRWGDMFVPQMQPWALHARGVSNLLPVREDVSTNLAKTFTLSTEIDGA